MMIHIYDDGYCVFVEVEVSPLFILEGSGISLADALRDLAIQLDDYETEFGEVELAA